MFVLFNLLNFLCGYGCQTTFATGLNARDCTTKGWWQIDRVSCRSLSEKRSTVVWLWQKFAIYLSVHYVHWLSSWPDGYSSHSSICRRLLWKSAPGNQMSKHKWPMGSMLLNAWLLIGLGFTLVGETSTLCSLAKHWVECYDCSTAFWVPLSFLTVSQCCLSCSTLAQEKRNHSVSTQRSCHCE